MFSYENTKAQISFAVTAQLIGTFATAQLISTFVFAAQVVHFLVFLNQKIQASSLFLKLCRSGRFVSDLVVNPKDRFSHIS